MYPRLAGVPSTYPSAASTSAAVADSAGRRTTSTPSSSGSLAPETTASNIACIDGDGVWWTISKVGTIQSLHGAGPAPRRGHSGNGGDHTKEWEKYTQRGVTSRIETSPEQT